MPTYRPTFLFTCPDLQYLFAYMSTWQRKLVWSWGITWCSQWMVNIMEEKDQQVSSSIGSLLHKLKYIKIDCEILLVSRFVHSVSSIHFQLWLLSLMQHIVRTFSEWSRREDVKTWHHVMFVALANFPFPLLIPCTWVWKKDISDQDPLCSNSSSKGLV